MEGLLMAVMAAANIACFLIGAKVGQQVSRGESVALPSVNPLEAVREHRAKKEAQTEHSRLDTILRNIDSYDGTGFGQEDVPGR